jgi:hypothetical protein
VWGHALLGGGDGGSEYINRHNWGEEAEHAAGHNNYAGTSAYDLLGPGSPSVGHAVNTTGSGDVQVDISRWHIVLTSLRLSGLPAIGSHSDLCVSLAATSEPAAFKGSAYRQPTVKDTVHTLGSTATVRAVSASTSTSASASASAETVTPASVECAFAETMKWELDEAKLCSWHLRVSIYMYSCISCCVHFSFPRHLD